MVRELKMDGFRSLAFRTGNMVHLRGAIVGKAF
jgi:hypothetical protein